MLPIARDILITIMVKSILLITLWLVCYKDPPTVTTPLENWMFTGTII